MEETAVQIALRWREEAGEGKYVLNYCNNPLPIVTKWKTDAGTVNKKVID